MLTASTPVIAVQPLAKARSSSHTDTAGAVSAGAAGGGTTGMRIAAGQQRLPDAETSDAAPKLSDEQIGRHGEDQPGFAACRAD